MEILYNPTIEEPEVLRKTLIARNSVLNDLLDKVRASSKDRGLKHYLIVGPRGIGKTHFLLVLHYTVKGCYEEKDIAKSWVSIKTHEEEYSITTLSDLLLRVLEEFKEEGVSDEIDSVLERLKERSDEEVVELSLGFLREFRKKTGKRILLLIENLDAIFKQIDDESAIGRIRDILMREDIFMVIGTALSLFKEVIGHEEPFYNFFEVIWLPELKDKEIEKLIKERAMLLGEEKIIERFDEYRPRIKATLHLTGGYPRLILMLFHIFTKSKLIEVQEALEELLDKLTPYFQDRMNRLPVQQRKILDTLALMDGPATPTEIAREARLKVASVNSQIKRLAELGYIQVSRQERRKTTRYEVTERLFRIWREMRTIKGRRRIGFLVKFLKIWYTPKEFIEEIEKLEIKFKDFIKCAASMEAKEVIEHLWYFQEAAPLGLKCLIHQSRVSKLLKVGNIKEAEDEVERLKEEAKRTKKEEVFIAALTEEAQLYSFKKDRDKELEIWNKVLELEPDSHEIWHKRGHLLEILGKHEEALENLTRSLDLASDCPGAWLDKGNVLEELERYEEALESFNKALEIKPDYAEAWANKGRALMCLNRNKEALKSVEKALKLKPDLYPAWNTQGEILGKLGKYKKALESFRKVLELKPDWEMAWCGQGVTLETMGKYEESLKSFNGALDLNPECSKLHLYRADVLLSLKRHKEALEEFEKSFLIIKDKEDKRSVEIKKTAGIMGSKLYLSLSQDNALQKNYGVAEDHLKKALIYGEFGENEELQKLLVEFLKELIAKSQIEFVQQSLQIIGEVKGSDFTELLKPFGIALEYLKTQDSEILERLHEEVREVVEEIIHF